MYPWDENIFRVVGLDLADFIMTTGLKRGKHEDSCPIWVPLRVMDSGVVKNLESLMASARLEQHVTALEAEAAGWKSKLPGWDTMTPWWEQITGTLQDDPLYERAMRLGQQYRRSLRPKSPTQRKR
jgi:hypothetical protein